MLACVKNARAFASPTHMDSHVDAVNYELFAATFAEDYAQARGLQDVTYKAKRDLKPARASKLAVVNDKLTDSAILGESA